MFQCSGYTCTCTGAIRPGFVLKIGIKRTTSRYRVVRDCGPIGLAVFDPDTNSALRPRASRQLNLEIDIFVSKAGFLPSAHMLIDNNK